MGAGAWWGRRRQRCEDWSGEGMVVGFGARCVDGGNGDWAISSREREIHLGGIRRGSRPTSRPSKSESDLHHGADDMTLDQHYDLQCEARSKLGSENNQF